MLRILLVVSLFLFPTAHLLAQETKGGARILLDVVDPVCADQALGVFEPLATFFVDEGLGLLTSFFERRAAEFSATYSATTSDFFLKQCGTPQSPGYRSRLNGIAFRHGPLDETDSTNDNVNVEMSVEQFTEGKNTVFRVIPTEINFNKAVAKRGNEKDLLITITFEFPTAYNGTNKASGNSLTTVLPVIEGVTEGSRIQVQGIASKWLTIPRLDPNNPIVNGEQALPFSLLITVTETDLGIGQKLFLEVASLLDAQRDTIVQLVVGEAQEDGGEESE